jgi:hypothetical protein
MRSLVRLAAATALTVIAGNGTALAVPDLRDARPVAGVTVYPDDRRADLFYYAPGDLAVAVMSDGGPDVHFMLARYTGSSAFGDRNTTDFRSVLTVRIVMSGPSPQALAKVRSMLLGSGRGTIELRPLPVRRLESALVYAQAQDNAPLPPAADAPPPAQALPAGHFETSGTAAGAGYWTERIYTLGLSFADAQLLAAALERGGLAVSVGYAFFADGIGPERPIEIVAGSPALSAALRTTLERTSAGQAREAGQNAKPNPTVIKTGAIAIAADLKRWPRIMRKIDIDASLPPGYAALDVCCYDFDGSQESALYEKQVEIEADGVGGRKVRLATSFTRSEPDLYARSLRFPVAVRLDRPYRFRVVAIDQDGTTTTGAWQDRASWTELLDVTKRTVISGT